MSSIREDALTIIASGAASTMLLPTYLASIRVKCKGRWPIRLWVTAAAQEFTSKRGLEFYVDEMFSQDDFLNPAEVAMKSRSIVVLPCTLNFLTSAAVGLASSPTLTAVACFPGRVLFFPSMQSQMWSLAKKLGHVDALRSRGHVVVDLRPGIVYELWRRAPTEGVVLPDPEEVATTIAAWLDDRSPERGGTAE